MRRGRLSALLTGLRARKRSPIITTMMTGERCADLAKTARAELG